MIIGNRVTLQEVANGIYEVLRLELVKRGLLPDFPSYPDAAAYLTAKAALRVTLQAAGKNLIEVVNTGSPEEREGTTVNTFYINKKEQNPGSIGGGKFSMEDYIDPVDEKRKFQKVRQPSRTKDINYEVRFKAEDQETENVMEEILGLVLGERQYLKTYAADGTDAGSFFIFMYRGTLDMTDGRKLDKRAQYTAIDLIIYEPEVIETGIPEATTVTPIIDEYTALNEIPVDFEGSF